MVIINFIGVVVIGLFSYYNYRSINRLWGLVDGQFEALLAYLSRREGKKVVAEIVDFEVGQKNIKPIWLMGTWTDYISYQSKKYSKEYTPSNPITRQEVLRHLEGIKKLQERITTELIGADKEEKDRLNSLLNDFKTFKEAWEAQLAKK